MVSQNKRCNLVDEKLTCTADAGVKVKKPFETPCVDFMEFNTMHDILSESAYIEFPEEWWKN